MRDGPGRAVWTDPGTRQPLSGDQLEQLDRLLHSEGSEPEHAVPVPLLVIARQARLRSELLASPWHTYETLASVAAPPWRPPGSRCTRPATSTGCSSWRPTRARWCRPSSSTARGEVRAELLPVLEPLLAAGMDPWRVWAWLTQPAALLSGQVPERAAADPEDAEVVVHAAVRLAERVADSD